MLHGSFGRDLSTCSSGKMLAHACGGVDAGVHTYCRNPPAPQADSSVVAHALTMKWYRLTPFDQRAPRVGSLATK